MSYLFESSVESAIKVESTRGNAMYLKGVCEKETASLVNSNGREYNMHDDYDAAKRLVQDMGSKFKPKEGPHAQEYRFVGDAWRQVSNNYGRIQGMVISELHTAYQIGLDIRSEMVIGRMLYLAVLCWSMIGDYTGYSQYEGKR